MIRNLYSSLVESDDKKPSDAKKKTDRPEKEEPFLTIKMVDGKKIRDGICVDFIGGGHHYAYPKIIPKDEVWIEQDLSPEEQTDILVHELVEFALMSKAEMTYTPAHTFANKIEKVFRGFEGRWKIQGAPAAGEQIVKGKEKAEAEEKAAKPEKKITEEKKWDSVGGRFKTPEEKKKKRPSYKIYKTIPTNPPQAIQVAQGIAEGEEAPLLTIVKQYASNAHPDDHVPEDFSWERDKAFNVRNLQHFMPGGVAGWKSWLSNEVNDVPGQWDKLAKTTKIDDPVIISPGHIWDGWHRIAAAIVNGHTTIPAIVGKLNAR